MPYTIRIDRTTCIGTGNCITAARGIFALDEQDKAVVVNLTAQPDDVIYHAAENCPVDAIILTDEMGHQVWPKP